MDKFIKGILIILLIISFIQCTKDTSPTVPYFNIKSVYAGGTRCYATISDDGGTDISERGFEWKTQQESEYQNSKIAFDNTFNDYVNDFETTIYGLLPGTTYDIRAYAINSIGTGYSEEKEITTLRAGYFTDSRDGRSYRWVETGNQIWMAENLSFMPYISSSISDTGIFVYNYKGSSVNTAKTQEEYKRYGCLYAWRIALNACPEGWHLPSYGEWLQLERFIGMTERQISGMEPVDKYTSGILKSPGWANQADNVTLFSALPGGIAYGDLEIYFYGLGIFTNFWSSTGDDEYALDVRLDYEGLHNRGSSTDSGYSVRCIKDY